MYGVQWITRSSTPDVDVTSNYNAINILLLIIYGRDLIGMFRDQRSSFSCPWPYKRGVGMRTRLKMAGKLKTTTNFLPYEPAFNRSDAVIKRINT